MRSHGGGSSVQPAIWGTLSPAPAHRVHATSVQQVLPALSRAPPTDNDSALKVDIFVLGDNLLDRMQIERSVLIVMPGAPEGVWVTSAEDQVLRKLDWFRQGGGMSDRQWRDVVAILSVGREALDLDDLRDSARVLALSELLDEALRQSNSLEEGRDPDLR